MSTVDPLSAAVERLRARRNSPPPFCPGAIGAKPHAMGKCPACQLAKRVRAQYDREHPPVPLGGPPEALEALADLLEAIDEVKRHGPGGIPAVLNDADALAAAITREDRS